ncbi:hypothetical protein dsx2_1180 [Desulfovibrio sp. X2]|uniref:TIGR03790 family protein n=1 Tax=Desulfovibrio sp. X2 TaxID=941449 RepID=UPI0003587B9E|nr:TIGR03790 family protein [Desulfovibrio sp. X2]EPR37237.1 hypothetical protein dsx2_1180 [Desulfovibrio sp. X2]
MHRFLRATDWTVVALVSLVLVLSLSSLSWAAKGGAKADAKAGTTAGTQKEADNGPKPTPGKSVFASGGAENGDSGAELRWTFDKDEATHLGLRGVRLYRLVDADDTGFRKPPVVLVKDLGMATEYGVDDLTNGQVYIYFLRAYNAEGKDIGQAMFPLYPGRKGGEMPDAVQHLYTASGPDAISLFWDPTDEIDVLGYEISRKAEGESEYTLIARVPRVLQPQPGKKGPPEAELPQLRPTLYRDSTVAPGAKYTYRVRSINLRKQVSPDAETEPASTVESRSPRPDEVLLLVAEGSDDSMRVARHYATARGVPQGNIVEIDLPRKLRNFDCEKDVCAPLRKIMLERGIAGRIRVIVPCFGIPLGDHKRALDSMLADLFDRFTWGRTMGTPSPLFNQAHHYDGTWGLYLVTRLDGATPAAAEALTDKALAAEKTVSAFSGAAAFIEDKQGSLGGEIAKHRGVTVHLEPINYTKDHFLPDDTMWVFIYGHPYKRLLQGKWPVGSVAAVLKSDSMLWLRGGPYVCWAQGLLEEGVTATFGSVVEPYVQGFTNGPVFFDRFWGGEFTFAESFAMATPTVRWAMCAVGDPLYKLRPPVRQ